MKAGEKLILPLWFRAGVVLLVAITLIVSFTHRSTGENAQTDTAEYREVIESQKLRFVDLNKGMVSVIDANNNREILRLHYGEDGFMRSVMRGMAQERKSLGLGPEVPFELTVWDDGLVSLIDPATQRRVELSAFGKDNLAAFTRLLPSVSNRNITSNSSS
ncbi:MAG: photosynthetic complex assembly protein PuhC [Granulosicoccus sp.]